MPHVRFLADHSWDPPEHGGRSTVVHRAGWSGPVKQAVADAAIAEGKAERIKPPRRAAQLEASDDGATTR